MRKLQSSKYQSYLLRLWTEGNAQEWRAMLEDAHSDTRQGFASLEALFEHLRALTLPRTEAGQDGPSILFKGEKQ